MNHRPLPGAPGELAKARRAVAVLSERLGALYDRSPLLHFILDPAGLVLDCNRRAAVALGRPVAELIGCSLPDLTPPEARPALLQRLAAPGDDQADAVELELCAPGGALFTHGTLWSLRAADGSPVEVHLMLLDVSEVRRLQQRMMQADRLASVGQLAAGVAHEINNPAAFVIANLTYLVDHVPLLSRCLLRPAPLPSRELHGLLEELPGLLDQTLGGMRRIRDIVRDLQLFARARGPSDAPEHYDLNDLCDSVANMAWLEIRRRSRLEKCYGDLPPLCGHPGKLSQVLMNLVINAAHAIPEGNQGKNKITLTTARQGEWATVAVRDTGSGIPRAVIDRIFDPFFTTKPPGQGTGLGLAVSHEIVVSHGGRIAVESEVGAGTTFTVWLPLPQGDAAQGEDPEDPASGPPAEGEEPADCAGAPPQAARGKVLLVDDEPELLRALARTLRPHHEVLLAGSGEEGRRLLLDRAHGDIDVVLCDVMMPETSGMDLYESLPRPLRDRFIFISGDTASRAARLFLDSVRRPHLDKPVEANVLRRAVADAVSERRR